MLGKKTRRIFGPTSTGMGVVGLRTLPDAWESCDPWQGEGSPQQPILRSYGVIYTYKTPINAPKSMGFVWVLFFQHYRVMGPLKVGWKNQSESHFLSAMYRYLTAAALYPKKWPSTRISFSKINELCIHIFISFLKIWYTLPETNIEPDNWWLEYNFPFGNPLFSGDMLVFGSV